MKARQMVRNAARERRRFPEKRTKAGDAGWQLLRLAFYGAKAGQFGRVTGRLVYEAR